MEPFERSGQSTEVQHKLKVSSDKITQLTSEVARWKFNVAAEVTPVDGSFGIKVTCTKPNGQGFFIIVNPDEVDYYANDIESLVSKLTQKAFEMLYRSHIRDELVGPVTKAAQNVRAIRSKK